VESILHEYYPIPFQEKRRIIEVDESTALRQQVREGRQAAERAHQKDLQRINQLHAKRWYEAQIRTAQNRDDMKFNPLF
jgi:hypothetical protein